MLKTNQKTQILYVTCINISKCPLLPFRYPLNRESTSTFGNNYTVCVNSVFSMVIMFLWLKRGSLQRFYPPGWSIKSLTLVAVVTVSLKCLKQFYSRLLDGGLLKLVCNTAYWSLFQMFLDYPAHWPCREVVVLFTAVSLITQSAAGTLWILSSAGNLVHSGNSPDLQNPSPEREVNHWLNKIVFQI